MACVWKLCRRASFYVIDYRLKVLWRLVFWKPFLLRFQEAACRALRIIPASSFFSFFLIRGHRTDSLARTLDRSRLWLLFLCGGERAGQPRPFTNEPSMNGAPPPTSQWSHTCVYVGYFRDDKISGEIYLHCSPRVDIVFIYYIVEH